MAGGRRDRGPGGGRGGRSDGGRRRGGRNGGRGAGSGSTERRGQEDRSMRTRGRLPTDPSTVQFIRSVLKTCPNHKLKETISRCERAWLQSWQEAETLPLDALKLLLSALARLPYSASIHPPPLPHCTKAVTALLTQPKGSGTSDGNDETLESVELVERVVRGLMKFTWDLRREDVKDALNKMITKAHSSLNIEFKTHRPVITRLAALLNELEKPWIIKVIKPEAADVGQKLAQLDWRHPTVAWLADYRNFQPLLLPRLQQPRSKEGRVYESSVQYFATTVKLWIGMTFVEGNNALLPHCTVKMGEKVCDQPLWPTPGKDSSLKCGNSQCDRYASFLCVNKLHKKGYCSSCADKYQQRLRGPPSSHASTHIYDGCISKIKYDGTISIEQVESRRPPLKPIHWRTTKRLSSPNLVGVVLLAHREASLRVNDEVYWGEIIFQGKSFDEYKARERGCLTLRLLQYLDEPGNALLTRNPAAGQAVAIIDCQTFVPEFVPVLKALEKQREMPVPFQNGALLNLSDETIGFDRDRGVDGDELDNADEDDCDYDDGAYDVYTSIDVGALSTHALIRKVVRMSLLDPIIDIRRKRALRIRLEQSLLALVNSATLDPGQLKSFAEAMVYPVHCTQGPPGTGKSYLGVVVVRALLIVRDLWKVKNREVGDPPILVLSYKNHAIDEFLLDLVRAEASLGHVSSQSRKYYSGNRFKKLVRIGGGCSEPELEQYRERNVAFSDPSVREVSKRIESYQGQREEWHKFRDCFSVILEAQVAVSNSDISTRSAEARNLVQSAVSSTSKAMATILQLTKGFEKDGGDGIEEKEQVKDKESGNGPGTDVAVDASPESAHSVMLLAVENVLKNKPMLANKDFAVLYDGIKHYDPDIDPQEVLYQWISGFRPLPACAYAKEPCLHICIEGSSFCQEHSCKFSLGCSDEVVSKRVYCKKHLCSAEKCKNARVDEKQAYCADHACCVCIAQDELAGLAVDEPPRNSCERHPLCWGLDGTCTEVAQPNTSYCKAHTQNLYCKWVSERGDTCDEIATTGEYCVAHHSEIEALPSPNADSSSEKCQALTRKGKACRGKPAPGINFCIDHLSRNTLSEEPKLPLMMTRNEEDEEAATVEDTKHEKPDATATGESHESGDEDGKESDTTVENPQTEDDENNDRESWSSGSVIEVDVDGETYDNGDEVEESEHLQHLREVYEVEDDEFEDALEAIEESEEEKDSPWMNSDRSLVAPQLWCWDMSLGERWSAIFSVLDLWGGLNIQVQEAFTRAIEDLKVELQREILRANARVYEGKSVIGGTITGCVSRLEAIRTTNPFAILVEEASEVMEPLLFACFSSSTRKLEMIGDHMQLQPSVMGRIDFERINKINISLFERLISAPQGNEVPSSVLSIQRRMRKNICDLTRNFYDEITTIEDHEVCGTKVIGSGAVDKKGKASLLSACEGGGREVPGVLPHVYFWTHTGAQQRASVGLSRVNNQEADMTCRLVKYLTTCGVPPKSIAVLTPYKGQLMLLRKILMSTYKLVTMTTGPEARPAPSCMVSTVDRFQGDEADIVIISLVIDGKSRTPFVKLQNRMIVLLSRARLGMYIIGNVDYFGETTHWQKTLQLLENGAESDNAGVVDCTTHRGPRIGPALPICCPQHRTSVALAHRERELTLGFCTVLCSTILPCSHACGIKCHWPHVDKHNKSCSIGVQSPCRRHPRLLKCSELTASTGESSVSAALTKYQCDALVSAMLPCGHSRTMKCYVYENKRDAWPICNKESVTPFVYPKCLHMLKCTCNEFDQYTRGLAPPCAQVVEFTPPCHHTVSLSCHDRQIYAKQLSRYVCKQKVQMPLPRCGHKTVVSCPTAEKLRQWRGKPCPVIGTVQEGVSYGPKDYFCTQKVTFKRLCRHEETVQCERAFELATTPSRCRESVVILNPECGHECSTTCFEVNQLISKAVQSPNYTHRWAIDPLEIVTEGKTNNFRDLEFNIQCTHEVILARSCGHSVKMKCSEARHVTTVCKELISVELPVCGHLVRLPCNLHHALKAWKPWRSHSTTVDLLLKSSIVEDTLSVPDTLPMHLRSVLKPCDARVRFRRTSSCGHDTEMKCCDAFKILQGNKKVDACAVRVSKQLGCGHKVAMECSQELGHVTCHEDVDKPCWNFASCGSTVPVQCTVSADIVQCTKETEWVCSAGHSFLIRLCSKGIPTDCPSCSTSRLETEIKDTQRVLADKSLTGWSPEAAHILREMDGVTHSSLSIPSMRDFLIRKLKLLERFKDGIDPSATWSSTLFTPLEIPVFALVPRKLQASTLERFEIADFGSLKSLNGIEVFEATQENFSRVAGTGEVHVVFGHLYSAKYLMNPVDIPNTKGKKSTTNIRAWVTRQSSHGYDALYRDTKTGGSWIVWHPYAMFPIHQAHVTKSNRDSILQCLPEKMPAKQPPQIISFETPTGVTTEPNEPQRSPSSIPTTDLHKLQQLLGSVDPQYQKLKMWYPWNGQTMFTGASEAISKRIEKTLASKLNFISRDQSEKTPFGGIKYIESLQNQGKFKDDGCLFLALEMLAVRKQDTAEARSKLQDYVTQISASEGGYAHPLVSVAIVRLAVREDQTQYSDVQQKLLDMFSSLYPEAAKLWLSDDEVQLVRTGAGLNNAASVGSSLNTDTVEDKWESLKSRYDCRSDAMEELLKLVGLKKVKQAAVNLFKNAMVLQHLSEIQREKNMMVFNYCFVGNPGTGKTTVARHFAQVLKDSQIRQAGTFIECTAQQLKDGGANAFRTKLEAAKGGVLFIDEAYELDPASDSNGRPIVAELLTAAENDRHELTIILAGYEDDIQEKLYAYNAGMSSRFEEVVFEDFDSQELEVVWDGLAQDRGWEYEEAIAKVACRRLAKAAGRKGFGNGRAVRNLFEQAVKAAMAREDFDNTLKFQTVDIVGERPSTNTKLQAVLNEVEEKTGWHRVKEEMKKLIRISDENYERELKGVETVPLCLNRLFLGNPGTGKTTCAGYYGRILKALQFLSNGEVVKKTASDFIGQHIGESQTKTSQILNMSKGKVLVIDEAYALNDDRFGKQVLDVLVEKVQETETADTAVLLIGYEHQMLEMFRTQNPGLMRRFPPQYAFHFEDYTEHELLEILEWNCSKRSVTCPSEVARALLKQLALQKTQPNFGNAGAVEQLLKHAMGKAMSRPMVSGMTVLTLEDVGVDVSGDEAKGEQKDPIQLLDKLYRMDEIKEQLTQLRNQLIVADREGSKLPEVGHFVFRGSPGTGKTTVARVMAEILHGMGVLATSKLVETSGLELTAEYLGQTKKKVTEKLGEAKGGLLFIDEAYELGKGKFGEEAMTTLVAAMTDPSYVGMVLIIAGYPKDMDQMLDRNVGLKSRFTRFIDFPDWEAQDAIVFLSEKAEDENFEVESEAVLSLQKTFVELKKLSNFGNGRDAVRVWKELLQCRSQRVVNKPEVEQTITLCDADKAGETVLAARRGGGIPGKGVAADKDPMKLLDELYRMNKIRDQLTRLKMEMEVAEREGSSRPEIGHFVFRGSPGTGKTTVARVMAQILHSMSALGTTKIVETSGLGLTGEYLGQTKTRVTEKLVEAKGGVLFIDEAYDLGKGHFGEEAMTTLVAAMTDPSYAGMVIVIAGYPKDMDIMLNRNAGLKSRFTRFIDFPDWEAKDGVAFLQAKAAKENITLGHGVEKVLHQTFLLLKRLDGFGNGRDAVRVWKELLQCRAQRVFDSGEKIRTITAKDAVMAGESILAARRPPDGPILSQSSAPSDNSVFKTQDQQPPQTQQTLSDLVESLEPEDTLQEQLEEKEALSAAAEEVLEVDAEEDPDVDETEKDRKVERDPGVSDEDWEELERAKEVHAAHLEALKRARDQAKQEDDKRRAQAKLEEERRRAAAIQEKIRRICPCPAGYNWYKLDGGWRCAAGGHFVSDAKLNSHFTR
ncbi:hypothetical protein L914_21561 [Phytophthora nicotianae]|uniref:AAA+ ATPase domain-containing protein n=2 Tax=Phytophthora nicotianae TaxID=4792 RepID=V9DUM5_PHYNI|nr:hypothetical protein F443_23157 [Phytophthora nicotianae P1569]ETM30768.1 hypothetical protein L914_21561 [Phytophthora nicotianae]